MNHLNHARDYALDAERALRAENEMLYPGNLLDLATLHAAIAQAAALTRIAEVAETLLDAQSPDTRKHIADLAEQLTQAQSEWTWSDRENDRLLAENKRLREQLGIRAETKDTTPEDVDRQMGKIGTALDAMRRHGLA